MQKMQSRQLSFNLSTCVILSMMQNTADHDANQTVGRSTPPFPNQPLYRIAGSHSGPIPVQFRLCPISDGRRRQQKGVSLTMDTASMLGGKESAYV
jgi:hypothetical protein